MASNLHVAAAIATSLADSWAPNCNGGYIRIYSGTQPDNAQQAWNQKGDCVLLAELRFANPAFGAAVNGVATANAITPDADADASGTATWFRALKSDGTTVVYDGSAGSAGCDLNLTPAIITQHNTVSVTLLRLTVPI